MDSDYGKLGNRIYSHCGFLKILIPKEEKVGKNCCLFDFLFCWCFVCPNIKSEIRTWPENSSDKESYRSNSYIVGSSSFYHRLMILAAALYLAYSDFFRFDTKDFENAAIQSGAFVTASSSWLPLYPVSNAQLFKDIYTGKAE